MFTRTKVTLATIAAATLLLTGCTPDSTNPDGGEQTSAPSNQTGAITEDTQLTYHPYFNHDTFKLFMEQQGYTVTTAEDAFGISNEDYSLEVGDGKTAYLLDLNNYAGNDTCYLMFTISQYYEDPETQEAAIPEGTQQEATVKLLQNSGFGTVENPVQPTTIKVKTETGDLELLQAQETKTVQIVNEEEGRNDEEIYTQVTAARVFNQFYTVKQSTANIEQQVVPIIQMTMNCKGENIDQKTWDGLLQLDNLYIAKY